MNKKKYLKKELNMISSYSRIRIIPILHVSFLTDHSYTVRFERSPITI